jgi:hypothetical protein
MRIAQEEIHSEPMAKNSSLIFRKNSVQKRMTRAEIFSAYTPKVDQYYF